jgi:hypothetical protein
MRTVPPSSIETVKRKLPGEWVVFLFVLVIFTWAYSYLGSLLILGENTTRSGSAQAAFVDAVYQSAAAGRAAPEDRRSIALALTRAFPHYTNGIVDPLFPWLMQGLAKEPPDEVFEAGKWRNFILSGFLLLCFGILAAKAFSFSGATAITLMGGFGVILERSTYFSSDALYYLIVLLAWICGMSLIRQNSLWLYGVFGGLLGLGYLTKPLVWPLALGFVIVSLARSFCIALRSRRDRGRGGLWNPSNQLVGFAMMIATFLLMTGSRLSYATSEFGDPFHSYHRYFIWLDSPAEASRFQQEHPGKAELSVLKAGERPGPVRYLREHGAAALVQRGAEGALVQIRSSVLGRAKWILVYGFVVFAVMGAFLWWAIRNQRDEVWRVQGTGAHWMLLYLGVVVAVMLFYAGVGTPVIRNNAMTTSLFLPILATFIWVSERYRRQLQRTRYGTWVNRVYLLLMMGPIVWISFRIGKAVMTPIA